MPAEKAALSEVAAFILAQAHLLNDEPCLDWPGTVTDAQQGIQPACLGLEHVFQEKTTTTQQLKELLQLKETVLEKAVTTVKPRITCT